MIQNLPLKVKRGPGRFKAEFHLTFTEWMILKSFNIFQAAEKSQNPPSCFTTPASFYNPNLIKVVQKRIIDQSH